jgi:hypothetical protein
MEQIRYIRQVLEFLQWHSLGYVHLVYDNASLGNWIPMFEEDEDTTLPQNIRIQLPSDAASHLKRTESSHIF